MKSYVIGLAALMAVHSAPILASCEDGPYMVHDAVLKDLSKKVIGAAKACKIREGEPRELEDGEKYFVTAKCKGNVYLYEVILEELEDALCFVKRVTRVGESG